MEIAIELERVERQAGKGTLTTNLLKRVHNDVSTRVTGDSLIAPTTEKYLNDWVKEVGARATPATVERYQHSVRLFVDRLKEKANQPITVITPKDAEGFLNARLLGSRAPKVP